MAQKADAEPVPGMRALDQARHVGHDERTLVHPDPPVADDAELRGQRGERIVRNARAGRGQRGQQRRFPGVGKAEQSDVGQQAEFQFEAARLSGQAGLGVARRPVGRGRKGGVTPAALPAPGDYHFVTRLAQVGERSATVRVARHGAGRDGQHDRGGVFAVLVLAAPVFATRCTHVVPMGQFEQRIALRIDADDHVAAVAAVATVRPAPGPELLTQEAHAATPAVPGRDGQDDLVDEVHTFDSLRKRPNKKSPVPGLSIGGAAGTPATVFSADGR